MLKTEQRNQRTTHIDKMGTREMLDIISEENFNAVKAVEAAIPQIEKAVDLASKAINSGGRLIYIGAGTSGRLGVLDAVECPPTFGVDPDIITAIIAGGYEMLAKASEDKEDREEEGIRDLLTKNITEKDIVCGISASGGAAYIAGALRKAKEIGCKTISLTCNENTLIGSIADIEIVTDTGAEVIQGSTRMKAGTAQKLVLNMLSTCCMIKAGNVYENVMVNLKPSNIKLKQRMINIVLSLLNVDETTAKDLMEQNNWKIRAVLDSKNK